VVVLSGADRTLGVRIIEEALVPWSSLSTVADVRELVELILSVDLARIFNLGVV